MHGFEVVHSLEKKYSEWTLRDEELYSTSFREMGFDLEDVVKMIEGMYVFLPYSTKVSIKTVNAYLEKGFQPVVISVKDFRALKKALVSDLF